MPASVLMPHFYREFESSFTAAPDDNARWPTLIADNIFWELAYAPSLGHPPQLSGRTKAKDGSSVPWRTSAS
jgi:hypothetical protein